jgi:hypothetical protein
MFFLGEDTSVSRFPSDLLLDDSSISSFQRELLFLEEDTPVSLRELPLFLLEEDASSGFLLDFPLFFKDRVRLLLYAAMYYWMLLSLLLSV